jgi:hypothetical protein
VTSFDLPPPGSPRVAFYRLGAFNKEAIAKALGIKPDKLKAGKPLHIVHEK